MKRDLPPSQVSPAALARLCLACLDLTSLGEDDDAARIGALCTAADTPFGPPAAVCVYPEWVVFARDCLDETGLDAVAVACVINFPDGSADVARAVRECRRAVAAGAQEIELVFPWRALLGGDAAVGERLVAECRAVCTQQALKVILESSALAEADPIRRASGLALAAGADFLKTSTGKDGSRATPDAAAIMLAAIAEYGSGGFKASGGLRRIADALPYVLLAERILGPGWAKPSHFRLGASGLLGDICAVLSQEGGEHPAAGCGEEVGY